MRPNLFHYATGELSQDAFICWLLAWAKPEGEAVDRPLHQLGLAFLRKMLEACKVTVPETITSLTIVRQLKKIDVLAVVNESIAVLIEDKTDTQHHSNQLERYRKAVEAKYPRHAVAAVYFKTGDQCSYDAIRGAGYACFLRKDLLAVLALGRELRVRNDIFEDFHQHLSKIEERVTDYRRLPVKDWHGDCWTGFFIELRERLGEACKWKYVPNESGGFMGFWWHWVGNKYLQLEQDKLCFKIMVEDKARRAAEWEGWYRALSAEAAKGAVPVQRLGKRSNGTYMTVARYNGQYRQERGGMLDVDATVALLRSAEALLDRAAGATSDQK